MPETDPKPAPVVAASEPATVVRRETDSPERNAQRLHRNAIDALERGDTRTAETRLREALESLPGLTAARIELARLLISTGRAGEAGPLLDDGLALAPGQSDLAQLRARLLLQDGALDAAASLLRAAPPLLKASPDHHALLAAIEQRRGRDDSAAEIYRQLVALRPDAGHWHVGLGISLERLGVPASAASAYASALEDTRLSDALRRYANERLRALRS
jgi:Tfp pilus assembly protein PilF